MTATATGKPKRKRKRELAEAATGMLADVAALPVAEAVVVAQDAPTDAGPRAEIFNEDCITGMAKRLAPDSVHLTVTSIPFEELFSYSGAIEDVSQNGSTIDVKAGRFMLNMRFVIDALFRVTAPGCNCCIHIQQLLAYKNQHGFIGRRDFRGAMIDGFRDGGWEYKGEVAIPKDPQALAQRLNLMSLQFKSGYARTSNMWAPAPNDFVLIFQKPGESAVPVRPLVYLDGFNKPDTREHFYEAMGRRDAIAAIAYTRYLQQWAIEVKATNPTGWISADDWIKWAKGTWEDIDEFDIIDGARKQAEKAKLKEAEEEKHVCPLQLEVVRRCILLYSNPRTIQPDATILDPFTGVGSTEHECVILDRNTVGFELKESYHGNAVRNVERARKAVADAKWQAGQPTLLG